VLVIFWFGGSTRTASLLPQAQITEKALSTVSSAAKLMWINASVFLPEVCIPHHLKFSAAPGKPRKVCVFQGCNDRVESLCRT
jgi:hypothetical protein